MDLACNLGKREGDWLDGWTDGQIILFLGQVNKEDNISIHIYIPPFIYLLDN